MNLLLNLNSKVTPHSQESRIGHHNNKIKTAIKNININFQQSLYWEKDTWNTLVTKWAKGLKCSQTKVLSGISYVLNPLPSFAIFGSFRYIFTFCTCKYTSAETFANMYCINHVILAIVTWLSFIMCKTKLSLCTPQSLLKWHYSEYFKNRCFTPFAAILIWFWFYF